MNNSQDEIWTCQDGRRIPVGEMSVDHLRNTLRMLLRKARYRQAVREGRALYAELSRQLAVWEPTVGEMQDQSDAEMRNHTGMEFNAEGQYWTNYESQPR